MTDEQQPATGGLTQGERDRIREKRIKEAEAFEHTPNCEHIQGWPNSSSPAVPATGGPTRAVESANEPEYGDLLSVWWGEHYGQHVDIALLCELEQLIRAAEREPLERRNKQLRRDVDDASQAVAENVRHAESMQHERDLAVDDRDAARARVAEMEARIADRDREFGARIAELEQRAHENFELAEQSWCAQQGMQVCRELNEAIWKEIEKAGRKGLTITKEVRAIVEDRDALAERVRVLEAVALKIDACLGAPPHESRKHLWVQPGKGEEFGLAAVELRSVLAAAAPPAQAPEALPFFDQWGKCKACGADRRRGQSCVASDCSDQFSPVGMPDDDPPSDAVRVAEKRVIEAVGSLFRHCKGKLVEYELLAGTGDIGERLVPVLRAYEKLTDPPQTRQGAGESG